MILDNLGRFIVSSVLALIASSLTMVALTPTAPPPAKASTCHPCGASKSMAYSPPCQWICESATWNGGWSDGSETISVEFKCGGMTEPCSGDYFVLQLDTTTFDHLCSEYDRNEACNMIYVSTTSCNSPSTSIDCSISGSGLGLHAGKAAYVEIVANLLLGGDCTNPDGSLMCTKTSWFYWDGVATLSPVNPPCG